MLSTKFLNTVKYLLFVAVICVIVHFINSIFFKRSENFDTYKSELSPASFPNTLLLADTYNVNESIKKKDMPTDYLFIKRNENNKYITTPDNGTCTPMEVCGLYSNKKSGIK
uniref:Uncharacterized protein n=1 Tax=viral metagenome TaxID=1070528 RepID=A0A6C0BTX9_9ZZZZ